MLAVLTVLVSAVGLVPSAAAGVSPGVTDLVSVRSDGAPAASSSLDAAISGDGRFVAFTSRESLDLDVPGTDQAQVYVRDLVAGTTEQVTITGGGDDPLAPWDGESMRPAISADGRYLAIQTEADFDSTLHDDWKIMVVDRGAPAADGTYSGTPRAVLVSDPEPIYTVAAYRPSISADGTVVVYEQERGENQWLGVSRLGHDPFAVVSRRSVYPQVPSMVLTAASVPSVSADGRRVAAMATFRFPTVPGPRLAPLAAVPVAGPSVVAFALDAIGDGGVVPATRLDVDATGMPLGFHNGGNRPALSGDGTTAVFEVSVALPCGPGCEFPPTEPRAFLAAVDPDGDGTIGPDVGTSTLSLDNAGLPVRGIMPAISADGRYAGFVTDAPNTHNGVDQPPGDGSCAVPRTPGLFAVGSAQSRSACQVVMRDLVLDAARAAADEPRLPGELASPSAERNCAATLDPADTCAADGFSALPAVSADGGVVAFLSDAADLVTADDNGDTDVFVRRFTPDVVAEPVEFGDVQVGDTATATTTLTPVGFGPLVLGEITLAGDDEFTLGPTTCGPPLHPGDSCVVSVDYAPRDTGGSAATLLVPRRGAGVTEIPVRGNGSPYPSPDPAFVVAPEPLDFGERLTLSDSAPAVVTVTNEGTRTFGVATVTLPPLLAPSAPGDYRITADECTGATLGPGENCTVTLVHQPQAPGDRPAVLQFEQDTPGGIQPHLVELRGRGTTPTLGVNPAVVTVGRLTSVTGQGFPPGRQVTLTMPGFPEVVLATTDAAGVFVAPLHVYPNSVPGTRVLDAVVAGFAIGDTENLLVVPGSMGPPDFLDR